MKLRVGAPLVLFALAALHGCGGSGGDSGGGGVVPATTAFPSLAIDWAARTRLITAPSSALSAKIVMRNANTDNTDFAWVINREDDLAAFKKTYTSGLPARVGSWSIKVELFSQRNAAGTLVAEGATEAKLVASGQLQNAAGQPLPGITVDGKVASVRALATNVFENNSVQLQAEALTALSAIVPVTPGSIRFNQLTGTSKITITPDGIATGVSAGTATVTATVDGKTSVAQTITCVARAADYIRTIPMKAGEAVPDPSGTSVFVAELDKNRVVRVNLETGVITPFKSFVFSPRELAISADGAFLYVGSVSNPVVAKVNTTTGEIVSTITFSTDAGLVCGPLAVSPVNSNIVAITPRRPGFSPSTGEVKLFNGTTELANKLFGDSTSIAFSTDGQYLYRYSGETTGFELARASVTATGLTKDVSKGGAINNFSATIVFLNNRLFSSTGQFYDPNTLNVVQTLPTPSGGSRHYFVDLAADRYLTISNSGESLFLLRYSDAATLASLIPTSNLSVISGSALGSKRFVAWGPDNLYIIKPIPENLP
jgi:hypothetical protein